MGVLDVTIFHPLFSVISSLAMLSLYTKCRVVFPIVDRAAQSKAIVLLSCFLTRIDNLLWIDSVVHSATL